MDYEGREGEARGEKGGDSREGSREGSREERMKEERRRRGEKEENRARKGLRGDEEEGRKEEGRRDKGEKRRGGKRGRKEEGRKREVRKGRVGRRKRGTRDAIKLGYLDCVGYYTHTFRIFLRRMERKLIQRKVPLWLKFHPSPAERQNPSTYITHTTFLPFILIHLIGFCFAETSTS